MNIKELQQLNDQMIYDVHSKEFAEFGRVIEDYDFTEISSYINKNTPIPKSGNIYVGSEPSLEWLSEVNKIETHVYGGVKLQAGYCNGNNSMLTGLEYHKASEVNLAVTPLVLILGRVQDIENNTYDSSKAKAFYLEAGTAVEIYGTTLHFAPCKVSDEGFKCLVILPRGTNEEISNKVTPISKEDELLFKVNKWLLVHPDSERLISFGARVGITGNNIEIKY